MQIRPQRPDESDDEYAAGPGAAAAQSKEWWNDLRMSDKFDDAVRALAELMDAAQKKHDEENQ